MYYFIDSGPKLAVLIWLNAGRIAIDHLFCRFLISCHIPEIFTNKVGSCVKSVQIVACYWPVKFLSGRARNFWTCIIKFTHI